MPARREKVDVSLFPFLSVLCTVIAVMVLLGILIINTREVAKAAQRYQEVARGVDRPQPGQAGGRDDGIDQQRCRQLEEELDRLNQELVTRKGRLATVTEKFRALQDLLESKKTLMEVEPVHGFGPEPGAPEPIAMVPEEGVKVYLTPIFIEVKADSYTVHPAKQRFPAIPLPENMVDAVLVQPAPELGEFLKQVDGRRRQEYLVLLVHPNGADAFRALRLYLKLHYDKIRMGWEPFARSWIVSSADKP